MATGVVAGECISTGAANVSGADGAASIRLPDRITAYTAAPIWQSALDMLARNPHRTLIIDASRLEYVDNVGTALLFDLIRRDRPAHSQVEVRNLAVNVAAMVRDFEPGSFVAPPPRRGLPASWNIWVRQPRSRSPMQSKWSGSCERAPVPSVSF
jgi:ABC-type transporter Mla MlaB component